MEIRNEIIKTKKRIDLLERQNENFKELLEKALSMTRKTTSRSTVCDDEFLRESIELIEKETHNLQYDLSSMTLIEEPPGQNLLNKIETLEKLTKSQQHEIDMLKAEHAEIKFLLLHPESRNAEWLKNILELEVDVSETCNSTLVEERFRLQRKILTLEKKKAELLLAINEAALPQQLTEDLKNTFYSNNDEQVTEYEDLRFKMLNLEDERSRLLSDLQSVLDRSRKEIAEEYNHLQRKITEVEKQKSCFRSKSCYPFEQKVTSKELESIFNAFTNIPLKQLDEQARIERIKQDVGNMFCPGTSLPLYCNIL